MRISHVVLSGFRCFDAAGATVELDDITSLIGANGAGKTAILQALCRLFGSSFEERRVRRSDFHVAVGLSSDDQALEASLYLEARITFPELQQAGGEPGGVPDCFRNMTIDAEGGAPYCRVRLEAQWTADGTPEGTVSEKVYWVDSAEPQPSELHKHEMRPHERSRIQVLYVPAARDPSEQLRNATGTLLFRLLRTVDWSAEASRSVAKDAENTNDILSGEPGVRHIEQILGERWRELYDERWSENPRLRFARGRLHEILRQVDLVFTPSLEGEAHDAGRLSDGLRSLFYFSLVATVFELERASVPVAPPKADEEGKDAPAAVRARMTPALTVFAVEEPEAHLAPHQLSRIMKLFSTIAREPAAQVVLTSHAPGIVRRVEPQHVRYIRRDRTTQVAKVRGITLPDEGDDACKFVRQAVQAHPELYFARLVVLGEGDSEDVVLPLAARAHGLDLDVEFVSIVPLGGRHVNHLWRLLAGLDVPFVTLLDLDREREGAGWGRIKYVIQQLIEIGNDPQLVRRLPGAAAPLSDADFKAMHKRALSDAAGLDAWTKHLEAFDVFFSSPLDLDFIMLEAFKDAYQKLDEGETGPATTGPDSVKAVLGAKATGSTYTQAQVDLFPWYSYLFLNRSKPATHLAAVTEIETGKLKDETPPVLKRLVDRARSLLVVPKG